MMMFPNTVEEFMEQYKIVDTEKIYTNGADLVPIFRMMQWFEHVSATDTISRQAAIDALRTCYDTETVTMDNGDEYINYGDAVGEIEQLPPAQPETTTMTVGRTKGEITMWYECDNCGEPVDQRDNYCPNCGRKFRKNE